MKIAIKKDTDCMNEVTLKQKRVRELLIQTRKDTAVIDGYFEEKSQAQHDLNKVPTQMDQPGLIEKKRHNAKITLDRLVRDFSHIEQLIEACDARVDEILQFNIVGTAGCL